MIKVLPAELANMIAAGEVVGRPASVVKELVENAVDAGATDIKVIVSDSGRTLIQVIDNGCGMSPQEADLCFERHATSKISTPQDLERIMSFGFRGEALASIAAVAEVTLKTRRPEDSTATQVQVGSYGRVSSECSAPVGTQFSVRNLFYNTPARRKFLKSDAVELKHIIDEFTRVALVRPDIAFSLSSNGRDIFVLRKAPGIKFRINDLFGANVAADLADLDTTTSMAHISGFVGKPESAKKTAGNQFFFVNGRYFRSPYLNKAVVSAYADLAPEGLTPPYFIFIEVDPASVDVNISPTKSEVKFEDERVMYQVLYACVKENLGRSSFSATIDFNTEGAIQMPQISSSFAQFKPEPIAPAVEFDPDYNPFNSPSMGGGQSSALHTYSGGSNFGGGNYTPSSYKNASGLFEPMPVRRQLWIAPQGRFILSPLEDTIMVVNVRRAYQRIIYEQTLKSLQSNEPVSASVLFPVEVTVGVAAVSLIEDSAQLLSTLGFDIRPIRQDTVVVEGLPQTCSSDTDQIIQTVFDILPLLSEGRGSQLSEVMNAAIAEKMAVALSSHCQIVKESGQAQQLIDTLFGCDNADYTPAGKRIVITLTQADLDKLFV